MREPYDIEKSENPLVVVSVAAHFLSAIAPAIVVLVGILVFDMHQWFDGIWWLAVAGLAVLLSVSAASRHFWALVSLLRAE
jgi:Mg2+/citrate symporter